MVLITCDTFRVLNWTWLPVKKSKWCLGRGGGATLFWFKITLDYWSKKLEDWFWAFVVSEIKITIDYRPKTSKKTLIVTPFGFEIPKKSWKNARYYTFWVQNHNWLSVKKVGRRILSICGICDQNHDRLSTKNLEKILVDTFCVQNPKKRSKKCLRLWARFAFVTLFGFKIALNYQSQKLNEGF